MEYKIDLTYLKSMACDSPELIKEMLEIFLEQIPEFIRDLNESLSAKEYNTLGAIAHKAKSSVSIVGMNNLANELKELELKSRAGEDVESYKGYIEHFEQACQSAIVQINEILATL